MLAAHPGWTVPVVAADSIGGMPPVAENGATFAANALIKARALAGRAVAGDWILADDSGLEVDALEGGPGLYSARYAGPGATDAENRDKLLKALAGISEFGRKARFRCALALISSGGCERIVEGRCEGRIIAQERGEGGFGYDALFVPEGHLQTFAELGPAVKDSISHRARALRQAAEYLRGTY